MSLPPTSTKGSGDATPKTTFQINAPNIPITHSGVVATIGTIPIAGGGTGQVTKAPAFDALQPMTTSGDIIYGGASGTGTRLGVGSTGDVLTVAGGIPSWAAPSGGSSTPIITKTTTYTMLNSDRIILVDSSGGAWTLTIPAAAAGNQNTIYRIKKISTDLALVTLSGGLSTSVATSGEEIEIVNDGTTWQVLSRTGISGIFVSSATQVITAATSNPTKGTAQIDTVLRWRTGRLMFTQYSYSQNAGGSAGTGTYFFNPPTGLTVDTSFVATAALGTQPSGAIGSGAAGSGSTQLYYIGVTTTGNVFFMNGTTGQVGSGENSLAGSNIQYTATWTVPITQWNA